MLDVTVESEPWRGRALCSQEADPDVWFPGEGEDPQPAKAVCGVCPVALECLAVGMRPENMTEDGGIYGGLTVDERMARKNTSGAALALAARERRDTEIRSRLAAGMSQRQVAMSIGVSRRLVQQVDGR